MKIVTAVVNSPMFIEMQYYTLKKYVKGDYEFIVFNDAKDFADFSNFNDPTLRGQITDMCKKLNIPCINIPNDHHRMMRCASTRTGEAMNYILGFQRNYPDKYLLLDSDMFLVDYFDVHKYDDYECMIVPQYRKNGNGSDIHYIWNGLFYFDTTKLRNMELMNWALVQYTDTGGMMHEWLSKQPKETIYVLRHLSSCQWNMRELPSSLADKSALIDFLKADYRNEQGKFFCEIYDNCILHYRAGGNWRGEGADKHKQLTEKLKIALLN